MQAYAGQVKWGEAACIPNSTFENQKLIQKKYKKIPKIMK
jgi:hypothetical protein